MNRRPPIARSLVVAGALVAAITLSSCAAFDTNNDVAVVDGHSLSQDDLQAMLESELGQSALGAAVVDGQIPLNSARGLISAWITQSVVRDKGLDADADRIAVEAQLSSSAGESWDAAPQVMRDLYIDVQATAILIRDGQLEQALVEDEVRAADVTVDSCYGHWDAELVSVVGFG